jgi:hypothetical protein
MKALTTYSITKIVPLLAAAFLLSACGSNVEEKNGGSAPAVPGGLGTTITQSGDVGTQCNYFDTSTGPRLTGRVTTTYSNGQLVEDKIRLRFTGLDAAFDAGTDVQIKFFRWQVSQAGLVNLDSTPVEFIVEKGATNSTPISNRLTQISATDVAGLRSAHGITGTSSIDFFANTTIVLQNVTYDWQALKVVMYDAVGGVIASTDLLLPVFTANPNKYKDTHPGILPALHPMFKDRAANLSDADWGARFNSYCF